MARVHIGPKPSTIFSSIGGGRSSGSTTVRFRGQSHGSSHVPPKEFVYREEDFQPLGHASHPTRSSNSGKGTSVPASSHGVHGIHRNPISSTLGLRPENHIRTSLGMNPALFLSRQKARVHVPSSSPPTSEGHAHAVPAHNDSKLKRHIYHVVNDPSDHHNHFRHQCDSEYCMDHNASHEHASHPSSISSYGRLAPHDHTSQAHRATNDNHARTKSPVSNIESLFKEPVTRGSRREPAPTTEEPTFRRRHSQSHRQIPGHAHAVPAHRDGKIKHHLHHLPNNPKDFHNHYRHQCDTNHRTDHNDSHAHHRQPPLHSPKGQVHASMRHWLGIARSHRAYEPLTSMGLNITKPVISANSSSRSELYKQHRRHSTGQELLPASHPIPLVHKHGRNWVLATKKRRASEGSQHDPHRHAPTTPEVHLGALFVDDEHGSRHRSRQIPGHAHAVPAHWDNKLKHYRWHVPNAPTDHHNHYRHQCYSDQCMDHNESHAHHGQSSVEHHSHQGAAPVRHRLEVRRAHHAYVPLTPAGLMIPDEVSPIKESKKKRHISVPSRNCGAQHIKTPDYVHENDGPQEQEQPDGLWTLVFNKNHMQTHQLRAHRILTGTPEMSVTHTRHHHKEPALGHHHHAYPRKVLDTPEMNLEVLLQDPTEFSPRKPSGQGDQRHLGFHSSAPWAPSAYDYTYRHSEEHHPPSIHSFSAPESHHTRAVPAHRGGKLKHQHHEENDPADHHNHHPHQRNDEDCSDHGNSNIHSHGGHSKGDQENHSGFVHYSTPHNRTVGSYDAKWATRLPRHATQTHHKQLQAPGSPELNLGALFHEDAPHDYSAGKTIKHKQSESQISTPASISEQHAHRIGHHHDEPMLSRSTKAAQAMPHRQSYAEAVASTPYRASEHNHSAIHTPQPRAAQRKRADSFHGYVFKIPKSLEKINKRQSRHSHSLRRRSIILSGFREVDPVSRYHPAGMYLAPTSVQHGLASAYSRRPSLTRHRRHYCTASQQQHPYPLMHHTGSARGRTATHIGTRSVKNRFSGPAETKNDLFEGLDTRPAHYQPVQGHVSEHTPVHHSVVPHVAQSASMRHIPSNTGAMPQKKSWYGAEVSVKEGSGPGTLSLGFGFEEVRKAAMEGRPLHAQHASGPSTPVSSTVPSVNEQKDSKSSSTTRTYSDAVAHPRGPAKLTRRPRIKRQRKDARREMKSTLDRSPHQTLRRRLGVLETVRTALSGVRMDLVEDMKLNEFFVEPAGWSTGHEGSAPRSRAGAVVLAGLGGIRYLLDAALNAPTMVARALYAHGQQETEHSTVVHHGQRHHHTHGRSKAVTLKTSRSGSVDLSLYPEEEPNYPRDDGLHAPGIQENPAHPTNVTDCVIEMPYHPPCPGTLMVSRESGNMRLAQGHHLAHHPHYHIQKWSTTSTRLHTHVDHATASHAPVPRSQLDQNLTSNGRYPEENAGYPRTDAYSLHRNPAHPDSVMDIVELPLPLAPMSSLSRPYHHGLYPEENAGYPRTDAFSLHRNPPHPNLQHIVKLPLSSSSSSSSSANLSTLKRWPKAETRSYNHSKAVGLHRPASPLHLYSEEQASYPRDAIHDVASAEYDPRADDAVHQSRVYAPNPYIHRNPVHEIQLNDEDQHAHHDAHPTLTESAAAAVSSGLGGFKAMLQNIHLPDMVVGTLLPEAHGYLQAVQHHAQEHQHEYQDHRPVLRHKEYNGEHGHFEHGHGHGEGSTAHPSRLAVSHGSFVPSEHHRRHVEHFSTSPYPPLHTPSSSSQSTAAAAALAAKHASPVSVLPPESSLTASVIRPPTGFGRGAYEDLGEGETVAWTKTVKTTMDFYELEDDNVDNDDEFSVQNQQHYHHHHHHGGQQQHAQHYQEGQSQAQRARSQQPAR
ncbi:hypothetical protein BG006_010095 [Podila minutissima]|uniref:Uncharacterized protein n=1 Tax=Podila minutissima TaxID=64525 RepID=A0A9P5SGF5_9FUNG|nr:hypothetical protein BG006_010095 [Podila minutissima]